ncbi:MAG: sulfotransferase family protein [Bacteroidota bacterium]
MENISAALKNWVPYHFSDRANEITCRWLYLGDIPFTEPFFDDTAWKCHSLPENSKMVRTLSHIDMLTQWSGSIDAIPPTSIIFHISRCGSTMLSQLLGLHPAHIVLSEVPFIDELLRWGFSNNNMELAMLQVQAAMKFYGAKRTDQQKYLFIKADSWHVHFYTHLRKLYPGVPIVLLYRKPDEVIRSQQKKRGMQAIPGLLEPAIFGFSRDDIYGRGMDEYMAMVIETYLDAFINIFEKDPLAIAANYNEGMVTITQRVAAAAGIIYSDSELDQLQQRAPFHGKYPQDLFAETMIDEPVPAYLEKSFQLYHQLEQLRLDRCQQFM